MIVNPHQAQPGDVIIRGVIVLLEEALGHVTGDKGQDTLINLIYTHRPLNPSHLRLAH